MIKLRINSKWQDAYLRYRELEKQLFEANGYEKNLEPLLRKTISGRKIFEKYLRDDYLKPANSPGVNHLPNPSPAFLEELRYFADLQSSYISSDQDFVFDDVYHIAFDMLSTWRGYGEAIPRADKSLWLYRGQANDSWPVCPKILRLISHETDKHGNLKKAASEACRLGHAIADKLKLSFEEAMAIEQHFSAKDELNTPTWLVDFSRDPWVGLFFASDGGKTGDCGIVWSIITEEWSNRANGSKNPFGPLQLVVPKNIKRIENQAGVFVIAIYPELFDQYVPFGWETRFKQHTGFIFEDPILGISRDTIYPPDDSLKISLENIRSDVNKCNCDKVIDTCTVPSQLFADPVDPKTYQDILESRFYAMQTQNPSLSKSQGLSDAMFSLAQFHAALNSKVYVYKLPIICRSLSRLISAFEKLCFAEINNQSITIREAIKEKYIEQSGFDLNHHIVMKEIMDQLHL